MLYFLYDGVVDDNITMLYCPGGVFDAKSIIVVLCRKEINEYSSGLELLIIAILFISKIDGMPDILSVLNGRLFVVIETFILGYV
jgi:hypothetical protein